MKPGVCTQTSRSEPSVSPARPSALTVFQPFSLCCPHLTRSSHSPCLQLPYTPERQHPNRPFKVSQSFTLPSFTSILVLLRSPVFSPGTSHPFHSDPPTVATSIFSPLFLSCSISSFPCFPPFSDQACASFTTAATPSLLLALPCSSISLYFPSLFLCVFLQPFLSVQSSALHRRV